MRIYDIPLETLDGRPVTLREYAGKALLAVNVASKCGATPQYAGLQRLHDTYAARGFAVLGFPCNQFGGQEPGTAEEIAEFCTTNYGVTFPMFVKLEVNGAERHRLYTALTSTADATGEAGDVRWNFEKFLIAADGSLVTRFRTGDDPESGELIAAIERQLPA